MPQPKRVALALGAGGARGYAHIGVIQVLEERGYEIVSLAGTSMGAVVGGLHAAGQLSPYTDWVTKLTQRDVLRLLDPSLRGPGVIRAEKILGVVTDLLRGTAIEDLPVPFTAVATDLLARKEVWFQHGPLNAAIRASIALPSVMPPVVLNGRLLADGGLMNPIPIAATAASEADLVVAVALAEEHLFTAGRAAVQASSDAQTPEDGLERSRRSAGRVLDAELIRTIGSWFGVGNETPDQAAEQVVEEAENGRFGALPAGLRIFDVMQLSLDVLQSVVARYRLAGYPPDVLVTVPKTACRTLDFHRAEEMIALGRARAAEALDRGSFRP